MTDTQKKPKGAGKSSFELIDPNILTAVLPLKPGSVVLDLACGKGIYSLYKPAEDQFVWTQPSYSGFSDHQ